MSSFNVNFLAFSIFIFAYSILHVNCAKTKEKPKTQMGIPFAYKHINAATFYDENNQTTTKKPKRARRFSQIEGQDSYGKRYAFSFKTLSELDLPPLNEHNDGHQYPQENQQNNGYLTGNENLEVDRHSLDFLGRSAPEANPESTKTRITEKLIASLGAETQKTAANVTRTSFP